MKLMKAWKRRRNWTTDSAEEKEEETEDAPLETSEFDAYLVESQNLRGNALTVGNYLMDAFRDMQKRHPVIGDPPIRSPAAITSVLGFCAR